jgi:hypothetical protein
MSLPFHCDHCGKDYLGYHWCMGSARAAREQRIEDARIV